MTGPWPTCPTFADDNNITGYRNGSLVWGQEPVAGTANLSVAQALSAPNPASSAPITLFYQLGGPAASSVAMLAAQPQVTVRLRVYSTAFQVLWEQSLDGAWVSAGSHSYSWDGRDSSGASLANGTYFYEVALFSVHSVQTQKVSTLVILR